jgi:hypothetical protein
VDARHAITAEKRHQIILDVKVSAAAGLTQVMDLAANCQIARIIVNEAALRY